MAGSVMPKIYSRIGVIGDVHAEDKRLDALIEFLNTQQLDIIFCVGDIVDGRGSVERCCELLKANRIRTTTGNHDRWCLQDINRSVAQATMPATLSQQVRDFLLGLPEIQMIQTPAGMTQICHGLGNNNMASVRPIDSMDNIHDNLDLWKLYKTPRLRYIVNGHSHRPGVFVFNHLTVINAGAVNHDDIAAAVIIDFTNGQVDFYRSDDDKQVQPCMSQVINLDQA